MDIIQDFQAEFRRKGWTQMEWAHATGLPQSTISRLLGGDCDPRLSTLMQLTPFLYTSPPGLTSPTTTVPANPIPGQQAEG